MSWEQYFKPHILNRGYKYYNNNTVRMIRSDNSIIIAVVHGTNDYDVEITIHDNLGYDMYCTCPYAEDGNYCKHMAAVLYTNDNDYIINENQEDDISDSASTLVTCANDDVVRNFLIQILENDNKLLNKFKRFSCNTN